VAQALLLAAPATLPAQGEMLFPSIPQQHFTL
jgi:hypothetical protein